MGQSILVNNLDIEELKDIINTSLKKQLDDVFNALKREKNETLLTRDETCKLLKINSTTLWKWTKEGKLISYSIHNRIYYKKSEIIDCLIPSKI